jgi:hypothetical protein
VPKISPGLRLFETFRNDNYYGERLSAPRPTKKLEDHPLSSGRDCLFNIFAAILRTQKIPSIRNLKMRHSVVIRDPPNMEILPLNLKITPAVEPKETFINERLKIQ